jgi:hypothetical protein
MALVLAGGGVGYAAGQITGADIKNGSVTGKDIKDGSLSSKDAGPSLAGKVGPRGPAGPGSTFSTVTATSPTAIDTSEFVANCPEGSRVVSGGHVVFPNVAGLFVARSYPLDVDTWLVRVVAPGEGLEYQITIVATCVSVD